MIAAMNETAPSQTAADALRELPSVDVLLRQPVVARLLDEFARGEVLYCVRGVLDERRQAIRAGGAPPIDTPSLALEIRQKLYQRARPALRRVINATGVVLHTGLGRAPLAQEAIEAIAEVAGGYSNLELNLATGERGDRHEHVRELLRELTAAEDALVVNNNAAGTYLTLNTLAAGRGVVVSRGQLVEIGGSYRMPDLMAAAGCRMIEVGTTNRTRIADYDRAIDEQTVALLHVHTSNYRIRGFVQQVPVGELAELAHRRKLLAIDDLGSGLLDRGIPWPDSRSPELGDRPPAGREDRPEDRAEDTPEVGLPPQPSHWDEPTVRESVAAGADLTLFSGDKLLGGPQAGVIVGRAALIERLRRNPLMRAFRPGKLTFAALEATLRLYRDPESLVRRLPIFQMLAAHAGTLENAARHLADRIRQSLAEATVTCAPDHSEAGGGSLPTVPFPTWTVRVRHPSLHVQALAGALRRRDLPIVCRIHEDALVFDLRTLRADDAEQIAAALREVTRELLDR